MMSSEYPSGDWSRQLRSSRCAACRLPPAAAVCPAFAYLSSPCPLLFPLQVEDLAPEHWLAHLQAQRPGTQRALRRCDGLASSMLLCHRFCEHCTTAKGLCLPPTPLTPLTPTICCRYIEVVGRINALLPAMAALSDAQLSAKTAELRQRLHQQGGVHGAGGDGSGYALPAMGRRQPVLLGGMPEGVVVEGFAVVREAAQRVLGMRHYDVQLVRRGRGGAGWCMPACCLALNPRPI